MEDHSRISVDPAPPTDIVLVDRFRRGDESAYTLIVNRYQRRLLRSATAVLGDEQEAQDMVQEAFIKAYFNLKSFRGDSALYTWLYRILHNLCISLLRRKKVISFLSMDASEEESPLPSHDPGPLENCEQEEIHRAVTHAMKSLPTKQRIIFAMRQLDGLKHGEIADILGITEGAVKASYFHAVQKLKGALGRFGGDSDV